jgi:hypothetical protein
MIVARQFIAWNRPHEGPRPVGDGMIVALVCLGVRLLCNSVLGLAGSGDRIGD